MKNYKIEFNFVNVEHSEEDMMKAMSNMIAFNGSLYMLDYHGFQNGSGWTVEDGVYKLTIIINVNKDYGHWEFIVTDEDVIADVENEIYRRNYKINDWYAKVTYSDDIIEIPEDYVEQYYANSYFDIDGAKMG